MLESGKKVNGNIKKYSFYFAQNNILLDIKKKNIRIYKTENTYNFKKSSDNVVKNGEELIFD